MKIICKSFIILHFIFSLYAQNPQWIVYNELNSNLPSNYINAIAEDLEGNIWIGTNNGLVKISDDGWYIYSSLNSGLPVNSINAIGIDNDNVKWLGVGTDGFVRYDDTIWIHYTTQNSNLPSSFVTHIVVDKENRKWICSQQGYGIGGILMIDDDNPLWTIYNEENTILPHSYIASIAVDNFLNVWVGLEGVIFEPGIVNEVSGGLFKFNGLYWQLFDSTESNLLVINYIKPEKDTLWIATDWGLSKFNGKSWKTYLSENSGLPNNYINSIDVDSSKIKWIGTGRRNFDRKGALVEYENENWTVYDTTNSPILPGFINQVFIDSHNNKWLGIHPYWKDNTPKEAYGGGLAIYNENGVIVNIEHENIQSQFPSFYLANNYPNPFNPSTTIKFNLPKTSEVTLKIFNILGEEVATLVSDKLTAGSYSYEWSRSAGMASGIYLYSLQAGDFVETKKMILMK